jgi:predicted amidohydrolase
MFKAHKDRRCTLFQVIAAAQAGRHNEKRESFGDALVIDPWGRIIARLEGRLFLSVPGS